MNMDRFMFLLDLLMLASFTLFSFYGNSRVAGCTESEKQALLSFKQDLKDPSNRLSSWDAEADCCKWSGILCDNFTGHVHQLNLRNPYGYYETNAEYDAYRSLQLGGQINPSLLNLKHLSYLDLSENDFEGIPIPSFIGSQVSLQYLNLSNAGFEGSIPHHLGNLSNLHSLSLRSYYPYALEIDNLQWLSSLFSLKHLDISRVSLKKARNWLSVINMLTSLVELHLSDCELDYISPLHTVNFTYLSFLDLSVNIFETRIPNWIFTLRNLVSLDLGSSNFLGPIPLGLRNMTNLKSLDLSGNYFNSTIPNWLFSTFSRLELLNLRNANLRGIISNDIGKMTSVLILDLSGNELEGKAPTSLGNLCNLRVLSLSSNKLMGEVSDLIQTMSGCISNTLESLKLSGNQFSGNLTDQLGQFKNLQKLFLNLNSISGPIPPSVGRLSNLKVLHVARNKLNGTLPESVGNLSKLQELYIHNNLLEGVVTESHFANLRNLRRFNANGNQLNLKIFPPNWFPPFRLELLLLSSWKLGPLFPMWLQSQKNIEDLDLSKTGISDKIPNWFWDMPSLLYLNLANNQIHGNLPNNLGVALALSTIYLNSNQLTGPLPRLSSNVTELDLSNNSISGETLHFLCDENEESNRLRFLNLEKNLLYGEIPNCWTNWKSLLVIKLRYNNFTGNIPSSLGILRQLNSLHLRGNFLYGEVPSSLKNCTELLIVDLSENQFSGRIPKWMGKSLSNLIVLSLRSNKFHGEVPPELCYLQYLQILDLANNRFSGKIPQCLKNFTAMAVKQDNGPLYSSVIGDFVENAVVVTKGREVQYDNTLILATSMDLSNNNIYGEIPEELTSLLGLRSLNLSTNHLIGKIPEKIGDMDLLESIDLSINQLSGEIPPSMSSLTFLSYLNVSINNLSGKIPMSTQLQSFNGSSFSGNVELCGAPLTKNCSNNGVMKPDFRKEGDEDSEVNGFYLAMAIGFLSSFSGVCGPLLFNRSWRRTYYQIIDVILYKVLMLIHENMKC